MTSRLVYRGAFWDRLGENMADTVVRLRESDVKGAVLPLSVVEDNEPRDLVRWLKCRGFNANTTSSKKSLIDRVKDLQESGLAKYIVDPDGDVNRRKVLDNLNITSNKQQIPLPLVKNWTTNMGLVPERFSYSCLVHYLIKRQLTFVYSADSDDEESVAVASLPVSQKPLRKGYNFFKSGHVSDVKFNAVEDVIHVNAEVLSSYKSKTYRTDIVLKKNSGEVLSGKCKCVAGQGGKCNHVAGVLFGLLDFQETVRDAPESCTSKEQKWHQPSRKAKKNTKPLKIGVRPVQKHVYGRQVQRKRPLQEYDSYSARAKHAALDNTAIKEHLKSLSHETGLLQILNSSTDTASEDESSGPANPQGHIHQLPEETVCQKLQVTVEEQHKIQVETVGQADNPLWFKHKKGRLTASNAKKFVGKGNAAALTKDVIRIKKPHYTHIPAIKFGIDNEPVAVQKYQAQKAAEGKNVTVATCGLFVDLDYGQLAASPDRLVTDSSTPEPLGLVEVKCLYSCRDTSPHDAVHSRGSMSAFPVKYIGDNIILKENHSYFYQIQMQLGVTRRQWCDLVLFTNVNEDVLIIRVNFDKQFWDRLRERLLDFHNINVVPALVAQGFYK